MMRHLSAFVFFMLASLQVIPAQTVWPGDINDNGVVNGVDLLYWGVAFGSSGPPRAEVSTEWEAHPLADPWSGIFPNGINYAYADGNGDGLVDEDDFDDAIEDNFGLEHGVLSPEGYANALPGTAPRLRLQPSALAVEEGATVDISLYLDDTDVPLSNFYGIAFTMSYTTALLDDDDGFEFDLADDNWIAAGDTYVQEIFFNDEDQGKAALAITRTNQVAIPAGAEAFGEISIVIEDIIVGLYIDTFKLRIDSVLLISNDLTTIPVVPDSVEILVARDINTITTATDASTAPEPNITIFPNPAKNEFFIKSAVPLTEPFLVDILGRKWPVRISSVQEDLYRLQLPPMVDGLYWLHLKSKETTIARRIFLSP